jgi:hypothetical protein
MPNEGNACVGCDFLDKGRAIVEQFDLCGLVTEEYRALSIARERHLPHRIGGV